MKVNTGNELELRTDATEIARINVKGINTVDLPPERQKRIQELTLKMNPFDSNNMLELGRNISQSMANYSDNGLKEIRIKDLGEVGQLMSDTVDELKKVDPSCLDDDLNSFIAKIPGLNKVFDVVKTYRKKYQKALTVVDKMENELMTKLVIVKGFLSFLQNEQLFYQKRQEEIIDLMIAVNMKLNDMETRIIPRIMSDPAATDVQKQNASAAKLRLIKRYEDYDALLLEAQQMTIQTGVTLQYSELMAEKIPFVCENLIPSFKRRIQHALGIKALQGAADGVKAVTDLYNNMVVQQAKDVRAATAKAQNELLRSVIDIETAQAVHNEFVGMLTDNVANAKKAIEGWQLAQETRNKIREESLSLINKTLQ